MTFSVSDHYPIPYASLKDVQATEEAFSPQKRTFSTVKHENSEFGSFLWVIFSLLDPVYESGYGSTDLLKSGPNPDPDMKHRCYRYRHWNLEPCNSFCVLGGGFDAFRAAVYDGQYLATLL
jgi:hypothetical protein